jgi:hypothetical protein
VHRGPVGPLRAGGCRPGSWRPGPPTARSTSPAAARALARSSRAAVRRPEPAQQLSGRADLDSLQWRNGGGWGRPPFSSRRDASRAAGDRGRSPRPACFARQRKTPLAACPIPEVMWADRRAGRCSSARPAGSGRGECAWAGQGDARWPGPWQSRGGAAREAHEGRQAAREATTCAGWHSRAASLNFGGSRLSAGSGERGRCGLARAGGERGGRCCESAGIGGRARGLTPAQVTG